MRTSARPPDQYVVANGTKYRLVPNEYDHNVYGQCNYASYRTLMRCKQIRSKEELAKNGGHCEEHKEFSEFLGKNHKKEIERMHAENDSKMQRRRYDPWIASNEVVSDEEDYLQAVSTLPTETLELVNDNILDDHPLRHAGTYTDKDVLKIKMDLVQKDIDDLTEFKQLLLNQAQKEHEMLANDGEEDEEPTDVPQQRIFKAAEKYNRNDYLRLTTIDPVFNKCCVGPDMDDTLVISHIVHTLLDKLDNFQPISVERQCKRPALHLSKFCIEHITLDRRQKLFALCRTCGITAIGGDDPTCTFHLKSHAVTSSTCRCHRCIKPGESSATSTKNNSPARSATDVYMDEGDDHLANLSKLENMVSPLQQFQIPPLPSPSSSPYPPPPRRFQGSPAQILRPPQMGPPPGSSKSTAAQRVVQSMSSYQHQQLLQKQRMEEQMKIQEEEMKSQTCARARGTDPIEYGEGKKKHQQMIRQQQQQPSSPFKNQKMTPNMRPGGFTGWRNTPGSAGGTLRALHQHVQMGSPATGGVGGVGQTRFPVQQQRGPPRQIPLERAQEPKTADELVEDRGDSPPSSKYPEPQRRGVPYYKNPAAFKRSDQVSRPAVQPNPNQQQTSGASGAPGGAPGAPGAPGGQPQMLGQQRFRPAGNRPMAPHRAIAAGLNPAEATAPRPSYRVVAAPVPPGGAIGAQPQMLSYQQTPIVARRPTAGQPRLVAGARGMGSPPFAGGHGVPGAIQQSGQSNFSNPNSSALDSARHDARFANMNVKTFLSMSSKDLNTMTQEEIDMLASGGQKQHGEGTSGAPGAPGASGGPPGAPGAPGAGTSSSGGRNPKTPESAAPTKAQAAAAAAKLSKKRRIEDTIDEVVHAVSQAPYTYTTTTPFAPGIVAETAQVVDYPTSSRAPGAVGASFEEPPAKKAPSVVTRRRSISEKEAEPEAMEARQDRVKTPKNKPPPPPSTTAAPTPTPATTVPPTTGSSSSASSGAPRAPRAAATAANQAIVQRQPSSSSSSANTSSQEVTNPLDLLAELSEAAAAEEQQAELAGTGNKAGKGKTPKKSSPKPKQRRSSAGPSKKRGESEEKEISGKPEEPKPKAE